MERRIKNNKATLSFAIKWASLDLGKLKKPKLRINLKDGDFRSGPKDRRKVHTFISDDRRSGIADRRKMSRKN